ncbi:TonB-dependent outer membrane siderophore receptor [Flavobacterium cauense R2A-7]|uniref:Iron complex outermembrane receptor protein n=1 Tax=Flavobacterium cauense R2A-7 TaxID=1341154 RepID=V6RVP3_9FLAO|nr:TonB-dependent receptor [Flavobacterium cauense]ESU18546.1 TonB-dependent outer membrane siderophore receptor [Flavobacterium cauense R2A-7]KGO80636.1 TonB-dependent receptor [Flavobacterium cauense R2A-7]TWI11782.1 iron complex outermembrane receptor protein [Flavobacterium cauense R2A-7]
MKKHILMLLLTLGISIMGHAQKTITGNVSDQKGQPVAGATILEKGTQNGTTADDGGNFSIKVKTENAVLVISSLGYKKTEVKASGNSVSVVLEEEGQELQEVQIQTVGSRNTKRTVVDSPVAVDIINVSDVVNKTGQVEINQLLQYAAPSFNASKQSGSDGADHIDPATLRGLGPDQTLVLINGKRRHQSSLVNLFGSRGRGNTGTDMNAIPAASIKRIEVLRDGASAQYGSDAIAGVINIVLKDNVGEFNGNVTYGAFNASTPYSGDIKSSGIDGNTVQINGNYGFKIKEKGFLNATVDVMKKDHTNRPANADKYSIYREQFGDAEAKNASLFLNGSIATGTNSDFYFFGGTSYRDSDAFAYTRSADSPRNIPEIYPNGFNPIIGTKIMDNSLSAGFRTKLAKWDVDFNNTFGMNRFMYDIHNTLNASLQTNSPTSFDAGGHQLMQNTTGIHFTRHFDNVRNGLNVAFGTEYRVENFKIFAGEQASYSLYDVNGDVVTTATNPADYVYDGNGDPRPGGSQGFPGYSPDNEVNKSRGNFAAYLDTELDISDVVTAAAAVRYENYSDFGSTFNMKWAQRFKLSEASGIRYSLSSGFRAPSLAQKYYNLKFTDYVSGVASETLLANNDSPITAAFGVDKLKQEKAFNASLGYTYKKGKFTATVDGYFVNVKDRIVLTGQFDGSSLGLNVANVQFFANAISTRTIGLDMVMSYDKSFGKSTISTSLIGNLNKMFIGEVKGNEILNTEEDKETLFGKREKYFLLASAPQSKFGWNLNYNYNKKFNTNLRFTRFGSVELIDWLDTVDHYGAKIVTDLSFGYQFTSKIGLTIGANNLLNIYPDIQDTETETGGNFDSVQMGSNGTFGFARLNFKF